MSKKSKINNAIDLTNSNEKSSKIFIISVTSIILILLIGVFFLTRSEKSKPDITSITQNTSSINSDQKQELIITAKSGYTPRNHTAKANIPTVLKVKTKNSYDCSTALVIPDLKFSKNLPINGETLVEIPPQKPGTKLQGTCSMGMYGFVINFQ